MTALPPLKTTSYHTDTPDSLALSKRGSIWSIGMETADGMVEFELSTAAACAVRQFFADAVCAECKPEEPKREPDLVDIAQRGLDRVAYSFRPAGSPDESRLAMQDLAMELRDALDAKPCDDRTCTDRDHWAPIARINHGSTPTTCVHGQDHPEALTCAYPCAATMPGHWCTRTEHADDRHVWAMSDEEAQRILREEDWFADPLDESDHRARHDSDGRHWTWRQADMWCERACGCPSGAWKLPDADEKFGPLTFCDCDDVATIEAENGATD